MIPGLLVANTAFAELKVAVLDVQKAILESTEAKQFITNLQKEIAPDADKLKKIESEAKKMQARLAKDGAIMSESERKKLTESIEEKGVNYKYLVSKLQNKQKQKQQELLRMMNPKVEAAIKVILDENKYDLVLQRQALIYSNPELDISAKLTEMLNK
ncbi:MAG: OmpH family outer membrane protein [Pseudomonadales bacterium]|nr:OmpH family outer membrane protein [Pseudomonadales bacterium]